MKWQARRSKPVSEINVVPYIDVMLVLLVIFMITAPILSQGITVDLPKAASETLPTEDQEPIIVSVDQKGQFFLNVNDNPEVPMESKAIIVRVSAMLELAKQNNKSIPVLVKGDQAVDYGKVVIAMSLLKQAGAEKVGLLTDNTQLAGVN